MSRRWHEQGGGGRVKEKRRRRDWAVFTTQETYLEKLSLRQIMSIRKYSCFIHSLPKFKYIDKYVCVCVRVCIKGQ